MLERGRSVAQVAESGESGTPKVVIFDKFDCSVKLCTLCHTFCLNSFMTEFRKRLRKQTTTVRRMEKGKLQ